MSLRTAVAVTGFNRPYYFLPSFRSILANEAITDCDLWIFLDNGDSHAQDLQVRMAEREIARSVRQPARVEIILRPTNLGCGRNSIGARRQLFDVENYDQVFVFEDDLVVTSNYIDVCQNMLAWADENYCDVGVVQAYDACWLSPQEKVCRLDQVRASNSHWWGYLIPRKAWLAIRETLLAYERNFLLDRHYSQRDSLQVRRWFRALIEQADALQSNSVNPSWPASDCRSFPGSWDYRAYFQGHCACGQDAATALALALAGYKKIATTVNRGLPIGRQGIHSTDARFESQRLDQITLDAFASDRYLRKFEPHSPDLLELSAYMRPDEVEAIRSVIRDRRPRAVLELGGGGSTVTFSREIAVGHWWTIESDDHWIRKILASMSPSDMQRITVLAFRKENYMSRFEALLQDQRFDMFFVDGGDRPELLKRLFTYLRDRPGFVLLHDYGRPEYADAISLFSKCTVLSRPIQHSQGLLLLRSCD